MKPEDFEKQWRQSLSHENDATANIDSDAIWQRVRPIKQKAFSPWFSHAAAVLGGVILASGLYFLIRDKAPAPSVALVPITKDIAAPIPVSPQKDTQEVLVAKAPAQPAQRQPSMSQPANRTPVVSAAATAPILITKVRVIKDTIYLAKEPATAPPVVIATISKPIAKPIHLADIYKSPKPTSSPILEYLASKLNTGQIQNQSDTRQILKNL